MTWNPPDLGATIILSIPGGVVAGFIVVLVGVAIRYIDDHRQHRKAHKAIGLFFKKWEESISNSFAGHKSESGPHIDGMSLHSIVHTNFLGKSQNLISRWSRDLTAQQVEELSNFLLEHEQHKYSLLSGGIDWGRSEYDGFFRRAREIKWLEF